MLKEQDAIRQARLDALRAEIEQGASSGPGICAEQVFANARKRIAGIAAGATNS
ncbi:hypothetical protein [Novosphingobium sp. BW1]|uniref:hypothetical protein n=1 Tax=Novosphingobium sp. BW1 TaxID=2592621 RepID=UPI001F08180E|nr:hypothetical protein [Novosphingobium sp. BW1]